MSDSCVKNDQRAVFCLCSEIIFYFFKFLKIFIHFIYVHKCFWNMYVSAQYMCVVSRGQESTWDFLGHVENICEPPCAFWELNFGPLKEQQMLWVYELSLQAHIFLSLPLRYHFIYQIFTATYILYALFEYNYAFWNTYLAKNELLSYSNGPGFKDLLCCNEKANNFVFLIVPEKNKPHLYLRLPIWIFDIICHKFKLFC